MLAQTGAAAKVQQQQQAVNSMSDASLEAFYNYTQANSGWQDWLSREQQLLQNAQLLEQKAGIQAGRLNSGNAASSNPTAANNPSASVNTAQALTPSDTSNSTPNPTGTSVSAVGDTLTVTINPVMASGNSSQGAAQTISDPTVIDFSNVPSSPTPDEVWSAQLAADLMGMAANIAQAMAGDTPSELTVVVVGEGTSVPDPARIAAEAIAVGFYGAQEGLQEYANHMNVQMANNNNLQASDLSSLATNIYNNLLTALSNISGVNNNVLTVNQNVQTVNSNVNVVDQHVQTLSYRDIERDLADGTPLVSLYLPVKNGGYLEDVQSFVQTLAKESASAGIDDKEAQLFLTEGNQDMADGAFYTAYQDFVNAYHLLQSEAAQFNEKKDKDHGPQDKDHGNSYSK